MITTLAEDRNESCIWCILGFTAHWQDKIRAVSRIYGRSARSNYIECQVCLAG